MPEVPRITVQEAKAGLDAGQIVIVDSRAAFEYGQSRIPGAISLPLGDMAPPYEGLNPSDVIATYCT
jgi:rhodanese-related sulfurtransferase